MNCMTMPTFDDPTYDNDDPTGLGALPEAIVAQQRRVRLMLQASWAGYLREELAPADDDEHATVIAAARMLAGVDRE